MTVTLSINGESQEYEIDTTNQGHAVRQAKLQARRDNPDAVITFVSVD